MSRTHWTIGAAVVAAATLATTSFAASSSPTRAASPALPAVPTPAALALTRDRVAGWLRLNGFTGFRVAEVMAFTNNDYVAVEGKNGKPAFELLVATDRTWLMEEPPSMMWNTRYGMLAHMSGTLQPVPGMSMMWGGAMMGSPSHWYSAGEGAVTSVQQAGAVANRWLAEMRPGETAETDGRAFPGYFTLDTAVNGKPYGMVSVHRTSGAVWYHGWHGKFVAEHEFGS